MTHSLRTTATSYKRLSEWKNKYVNHYTYTHTHGGANICCKGTNCNIHTSLVASWCSTRTVALITAPCWQCVTICLQSCGMCPRDGTWSASEGCACSRHTKALVTVSNSSTCTQPVGVNVLKTIWQIHQYVKSIFSIVAHCCTLCSLTVNPLKVYIQIVFEKFSSLTKRKHYSFIIYMELSQMRG